MGIFESRDGIGRAALWLAALLALTPGALAAPPPIHNLGTFGANSTHSRGIAINNSGVVVGESYTPAQSGYTRLTVFKWSAGSGAEPIVIPVIQPSPPFYFPVTSNHHMHDINDNGVILGSYGVLSDGGFTKFVNVNNTLTEMPQGNYVTDESATAINNSNVVVTGMDNGLASRAYRWVPGSAPVSLGLLPGQNAFDANSNAVGINDSGVIVGGADRGGTSSTRAMRHTTASGMEELPSLGGGSGFAYAINNPGTIVGSSTSAAGKPRPVKWVNGAIQALDAPAEAYSTLATAINNNDWIIGRMRLTETGTDVSLLWTSDGVRYDLNALLDVLNPAEGAKWTLTSVAGINDLGSIVGTGTYNDGAGGLTDGQRGFVFDVSAVPEPGGLLAAVLMIHLAARRRRGI